MSDKEQENKDYFGMVLDELPELLSKDEMTRLSDPVNSPNYYNKHPSGIECIEIVKHYDFCIGNVIKYCWRAGLKGETNEKEIEDLKKARKYLDYKIEMLTNKHNKENDS